MSKHDKMGCIEERVCTYSNLLLQIVVKTAFLFHSLFLFSQESPLILIISAKFINYRNLNKKMRWYNFLLASVSKKKLKMLANSIYDQN